MVWNHFVNRKFLSAPYTQTIAMRYRPEPWSVDHPGIGSLTYSLLPTNKTPLPKLQ
jgi:hypothetical protein